MKNKGTTIIELIICIITIFIIAVVSPPIILKYVREKGQKDIIYEKSLLGMNYNNTEGWYKNCKIKIFYHIDESKINNFISNKDVVDIKTTKNQVLIIYTDSLKGNEYEEIN